MNNDSTTQEIQEQIFDLRSEQADVTPAERVEIQEQIEDLYRQMDGQS